MSKNPKPALRPTIDANTDAHVEARADRRPLLKLLKKPSPGASIDAHDPVEQASYDSFPASDPPAFSPTRVGRATEDDRREDDQE